MYHHHINILIQHIRSTEAVVLMPQLAPGCHVPLFNSDQSLVQTPAAYGHMVCCCKHRGTANLQ